MLFPTPPLPDATAMTFFTPGSNCSAVRGVARRTLAPQVSSTNSTPIGSSAAWTRDSISSLSGQAGVVSSIVKATALPSTLRSRTMFRVTRSPPSSGSWTVPRAVMTAASVTCGMRSSKVSGDLRGSGVDIVDPVCATCRRVIGPAAPAPRSGRGAQRKLEAARRELRRRSVARLRNSQGSSRPRYLFRRLTPRITDAYPRPTSSAPAESGYVRADSCGRASEGTRRTWQRSKSG